MTPFRVREPEKSPSARRQPDVRRGPAAAVFRCTQWTRAADPMALEIRTWKLQEAVSFSSRRIFVKAMLEPMQHVCHKQQEGPRLEQKLATSSTNAPKKTSPPQKKNINNLTGVSFPVKMLGKRVAAKKKEKDTFSAGCEDGWIKGSSSFSSRSW